MSMGTVCLWKRVKRVEYLQGIYQKGGLDKSCQGRVRLRKASLCPCVGWLMWGLSLERFVDWDHVLGLVIYFYVPALFGRMNLRCLTTALCRVSGQLFLFSVRRQISFFLWAYGRPEILSNVTFWAVTPGPSCGVNPHLCASSGCLKQKCFHLAVHFLAGSHPGQATLGKSVKAWQMGGKTY